MDTLKTIVKRTAAVVFLADFIHVYTYLNNYYKDDEVEGVYDDERLYEDQRIVQAYLGDCAPESLVSNEEFEKCVEEVLESLDKDGVSSGLHKIDDIALKINRESIVFAGGGRATFLQLAHPFIAAGIRQHSMLERGVSRRFYNTFKYMFGMIFGTKEEVAKSSRFVRSLHNKVTGEMREDVGIFSASSRFAAAEKNAIRFVAATLLETAVFEYEMHVRILSDEEKDALIRSDPRLLMLFGVRPTPNDPKTYKEFRRMMSAMFRSKVLTVSETAKDTAEFLLLPPAPIYKPLLDTIQWSTAVSLPPRLAKQYTGRTPNVLDKILFSIFHAIIRFIYRLTPPSWRYLAAYWRMYDRERPNERSIFSKMVSQAAAKFTSGFLAMAMPERDPEEATRMVREKREKRIAFQKVAGSPIKVGA